MFKAKNKYTTSFWRIKKTLSILHTFVCASIMDFEQVIFCWSKYQVAKNKNYARFGQVKLITRLADPAHVIKIYRTAHCFPTSNIFIFGFFSNSEKSF